MRRLASSTTVLSRFQFPSIGFSGAGFLGSYHAGVYASLLKHDHLLRPTERNPTDAADHHHHHRKRQPILTGVSAGALVSAAIAAGVTPEDAMDTVLAVAERTREKGGTMDVLRPGFSLVDQLEGPLISRMRRALGGGDSPSPSSPDDYDRELLQNRIGNGPGLRIGLADRRTLDPASVERDLGSYVYVDRYRDVEDVVAACVLSSYIPIGTGPLRGENDTENPAVGRAWGRVREMERRGFLKHGVTGLPVSVPSVDGVTEEEGEEEGEEKEEDDKLRYIDGGLVNMFPEIDASTVVVSPLNGIFVPPSISSLHTPSEFHDRMSELTNRMGNPSLLPPYTLDMGGRVKIGMNGQNLREAYLMARSSGADVLEERFRNGYDDTERFLRGCGALTKFSA